MYGLDALRQMRERLKNPEPAPDDSPLAAVPVDAPYDEQDAVVHAWTGGRWVPYRRWRATAPVPIEEAPPEAKALARLAGAAFVAARCGGTQVWLKKDGERWVMYAGSKRDGRRRDFASPSLAHAIRTAEYWYGAATGGWRAVGERDGKRDSDEAPGVSAEDSTVEEEVQERHDHVDLDGPEPGR